MVKILHRRGKLAETSIWHERKNEIKFWWGVFQRWCVYFWFGKILWCFLVFVPCHHPFALSKILQFEEKHSSLISFSKTGYPSQNFLFKSKVSILELFWKYSLNNKWKIRFFGWVIQKYNFKLNKTMTFITVFLIISTTILK